jgi:hypothetical protein
MAIEIKIDIKDAASPSLDAIVRNLRDRTQLHGALGGWGERTMRDYFARRESQPNKRGWPSQHFWDQIRSATALSKVDQDGATITVNDSRLAQKVYGGTILPGAGKKYLALPAIAAAAGRSPLSMTNLQPVIRFINGERRAVALAERLASEISYGRLRKDGTRAVKQTASRTGGIWYWLVKSVTQNKDELALPDEEGFRRGLLDETRAYLDQFGTR